MLGGCSKSFCVLGWGPLQAAVNDNLGVQGSPTVKLVMPLLSGSNASVSSLFQLPPVGRRENVCPSFLLPSSLKSFVFSQPTPLLLLLQKAQEHSIVPHEQEHSRLSLQGAKGLLVSFPNFTRYFPTFNTFSMHMFYLVVRLLNMLEVLFDGLKNSYALSRCISQKVQFKLRVTSLCHPHPHSHPSELATFS